MERLSPEGRLLELIEAKPSRNAKQEMLSYYSKSSKLRKIFDYTYNPHKRYYIAKRPAGSKGLGASLIGPNTWQLLDRIIAREVTGNEAITLLKQHMAVMNSGEADLLWDVIRGRLGIGISVKGANAVWPGLIPESGLQKAEDYDSTIAEFPMYASLKLDGIRGDFDNSYFVSRNGHPITGLEFIGEYLRHKKVKHLDGELIVPSLSEFDDASGYLRSKRPEKIDARFVVFDNPLLERCSQRIRLDSLPPVLDKYRHTQGLYNAPATYLHHWVVHSEQELFDLFHKVVGAGHEGLVVKTMDNGYFRGRSYNWMKLKKGWEGELEIIDYYEGEDDLVGTLGGVIVRVSSTRTCRVGSGFTLRKREEMWKDPAKFLGRPATIMAMEKTRYGSLRHPVFKTDRWDIS